MSLAAAWLTGCATPLGVATDGGFGIPAPTRAEAEAETSQPANTTDPKQAARPNEKPPGAVAAANAPEPPLPGWDPETRGPGETQRDLWERLRAGFSLPGLEGDEVQGREKYYASRAEGVRRMTERAGRYLFHIIEAVERRKMPTELALLPFVESAFDPQALSSAKAAGMWQFIPSTGKDYALRQNVFRDDRRDVLASTRAALDYLSRLYTLFGDWHLALAAYNWGEGNVKKAMAHNEKAGRPTDYAGLRMPNETRLYVPKLLAIRNIVAEPERFGVQLAELRNHPYFISVPIERDMDVATAAQLAEIKLDEFRHLNPQMNRPVILAAGTEQLLLPYDNAVLFTRNLAQHSGPLATWTAWVAPRKMRPAEVAKEVGMSEASLREINRIPARMLVEKGSALVVPRAAHRSQDVSPHLADHATMALTPDAPALRRLALRTGPKGDTVAAIAQRHRVSPAQVAQWNRLSSGASLKPGAPYVVFVAANSRAATPPKRRTTATSPARLAQK